MTSGEPREDLVVGERALAGLGVQNDPALFLLPPLITTPNSPLSKRTPASGLSNLFSSSEERTPSLCISSSWRSTDALSHVGAARLRQPNSSEISISKITAIRPWFITRRASIGLVTTWKKPLPGPPACAST